MDIQEARQKLLDNAGRDITTIKNILEDYRIDSGIPISLFIECLATVTQDYKLMREIYKK